MNEFYSEDVFNSLFVVILNTFLYEFTYEGSHTSSSSSSQGPKPPVVGPRLLPFNFKAGRNAPLLQLRSPLFAYLHNVSIL